jgi:hypothetical protein
MTLDKLQYPARTRTTRLCAAPAAALAIGLCVFSYPDHARTISHTESSVVARRLRRARQQKTKTNRSALQDPDTASGAR